MGSTEKLIKEIHEVIVEGKAPKNDLIQAAKKVVAIRYDSSKEWEDLKYAIGYMGEILEKY